MEKSLRYDTGTDYELSTYAYIENGGVCFSELHEPERDYPGDTIAPAQNVHVTCKDAVPLCLWVLDNVHKDPLAEQSAHQLTAQIRGLQAQVEHVQAVRDANAEDLASALGFGAKRLLLPQVIDHALEEIPKLKARTVSTSLLWVALSALEDGKPPPERMRESMIKSLKEALEKLGEPVEDSVAETPAPLGEPAQINIELKEELDALMAEFEELAKENTLLFTTKPEGAYERSVEILARQREVFDLMTEAGKKADTKRFRKQRG